MSKILFDVAHKETVERPTWKSEVTKILSTVNANGREMQTFEVECSTVITDHNKVEKEQPRHTYPDLGHSLDFVAIFLHNG